MTQKGNVFAGPRCKFKIEGKTIGYGTNVEIGESIEYTPCEVLDNIEVAEWVAVSYRVNFTCGSIKLVNQSLKQQGLFPNTGKSSEDHLLNILNSGDLTATIEDSKAPYAVIATITGVKVASHNFRVSARAIVGEDITFVGTRILSEGEI